MTVLSNIITPSNVLTTTNTATVTNKTLTSPILTTPTLGVATATSLQGIIGNVTPAAGAFTSLSASTTLGVTGVSTLTGGAVVQSLTVGLGGGANSSNTAVGLQALNANTSGSANAAVGYAAMQLNTTGGGNSAFGYLAVQQNTTGSNNTGIGDEALRYNTTASNNTAVGYQAGYTGTTAANNSWVGYNAGKLCTGNYNTGMGDRALAAMASAEKNSAFGMAAAINVTTGSYNTAMGSSALESLTTGSTNTAVGYASAYLITTGSKNSILGSFSGNQGGLDIRTASNYIVLSDGDGNPRAWWNELGNASIGATTITSIGSNIRAVNIAASGGAGIVCKNNASSISYAYNDGGNDRFYISQNSAGVYLANGGTSWTSASDERVKDIIEPITDAANKVSTLRAVIGKYKTDAEGKRRSFLIAQDVQAVLPEAVDSTNPNELGVSYADVIPLLVAAIKELKAEVDSLKSQLKGA